MTEIRSRILCVLLFLVPFKYNFAGIIYVNINNPTPGTGANWATAYNDLNLALSASAYGDQVWVAQGVYKPTTTSDRTISFEINSAISLYGGFTGVETTLGARNPTANLTILSGDIGVAGDFTDNSYNVVTINSNFSSATIDGFTIRDGNGNQNYPATTALQPYNQAGGILAKAGPNGYVGALIDHCIITSNFGVYGGGICTYAYGNSSIIEVQVNHDLFLNNSSVFGGGVAWVSQNGGNGLTTVESCIFNGNSSPTGSGSAIAVDADGSTTYAGMEIDNSTFYNNPAPLFNNIQTGGSTSNFYTNDCILWQGAGYYTGALSIGSSAHIQNCDVDLASPGSANTNNDPEFVNAAGGDFHLQPCSPDIDAGGIPVLNSNTDYGGNPRVQNNAIDWGAYESSKTISPTTFAFPATYCQNSTASPITTSPGTDILWYTTATGGVGSSVDPIPSTATVGTTKYWVTQTLAGECESSRSPVTITITASPAAPTTSPVSYCENTSAAALTATGTALLWYTDAIGGVGSSIAPVPSTTASGTTTWYVSQTVGCESLRAPLAVALTAPPAAPTTSPVSYCENTSAVALTATGTALLWYTDAIGGVGSSIAPVPSTTANGTTTWYVSQTIGCESPRAPLAVAVIALPTIHINLVATNFCPGSSVTLDASGASTYSWSPVTDLSNPSISNPVAVMQGDILYTVTGTDANGCIDTAQILLKSGSDCLGIGYYVPNAFTPNGDGRNDHFRVKSGDNPQLFRMMIFNRYGGKVFESGDIEAGWDGTIGGSLAPTGAYVYTISITASTGAVINKQGTVMLIR